MLSFSCYAYHLLIYIPWLQGMCRENVLQSLQIRSPDIQCCKFHWSSPWREWCLWATVSNATHFARMHLTNQSHAGKLLRGDIPRGSNHSYGCRWKVCCNGKKACLWHQSWIISLKWFANKFNPLEIPKLLDSSCMHNIGAIRENLSLHVVACRYMSLHSTSARPGTKEAWPPQGFNRALLR